MEFNQWPNLEIDGGGSTLLNSSSGRTIYLNGCSNVNVHDLAIDYDPLPFTQGTVSASGPDWFILRVDSGFPVPPQTELTALGAYDRSIRNYAQNPIEIYGKDVASVQATGTSDLRIQFKNPKTIPVGTVLVLRFKQSGEALGIKDSQNVTVRNLNLYSSHSMGFVIATSKDLLFDGMTIGMPAGSNRLLSTLADGMHCTSCSGSFTVRNCTFQGMGDDAINIYARMLRLKNDPTAGIPAVVKGSGAAINPGEAVPVKPSDRLEVIDPRDMHAVTHARLVPAQGAAFHVQPESGNPSDLDGALVVDPEFSPTVQITNCRFLGNRARNVLVHSKAQITNCFFQNSTSAAILLAPNPEGEGPLTRNVTIQGNHFVGCHYGFKAQEGSITVDTNPYFSQRKPVPNAQASGVKISDNFFETCPTAAISCRSVEHLTIENNRIGRTWTKWDSGNPPRAIILSQITDSAVLGNTSTIPSAIVVQNSPSVNVANNTGFTVDKS